MKNSECVAFLQWALPRLRMRWPGFRRVRRQVCKRLKRRLQRLGLPDLAAYQAYLERTPGEWAVLDGLCYVTISRFYRDRRAFGRLRRVVWPYLAGRVPCQQPLRCWSIGCASGEEAYTLSLIWHLDLGQRFDHPCQILATDIKESMLVRAQAACYPASSLRELPRPWRRRAFSQNGGLYCLHAAYREGVTFQQQDIRSEQPPGRFHLILCRNLVFTYYEEELQQEMAGRLHDCLQPGGVLMLGRKETLPAGNEERFTRRAAGLYQKV